MRGKEARREARVVAQVSQVISFPQAEVLALCSKYGPDLHIDSSQPQLQGRFLMAAFAANESSLGADCTPRYEPAWDVDGEDSKNSPLQQQLLREFGKDAAYSYGVWQVMFFNCPGYTPAQLVADAAAGAQCFLDYFNTYVQSKGGITLEQLGQIYNGGHVFGDEAPLEVQQYTNRLQMNYARVGSLF